MDQFYYKLEKPFTDEDGNEVTVDLFMLDTVQWAGLNTHCDVFRNATDEMVELLWESPSAIMADPINNTFEEAKAECAGSERGSCCLVDSYYNHLPPPPPPLPHDGGPCDEESWPDLDGGTICGECYVLVDRFSSKYHSSCDEYCRSVNRTCTGAWEEYNDDCRRYEPALSPTAVTCSSSTGRSTSDALCECLGEQTASEPEPEPEIPTWPTVGDPGPCDEASWPDKDHDLICGECTVLVNHFDSSYETCDGYCGSMGRTCIGAWEEDGDSCSVLYAAECATAIPGSDALCQCSESAGITPSCVANGIDEAEWAVRAGLVDTVQSPRPPELPYGAGLLQTLRTNCDEVVANKLCQTDISLLDTTALDSLPTAGRIVRSRVQTILDDNVGMNIGSLCCPQACGVCPFGDGVHEPPEATSFPGQDYTCSSGDPQPTGLGIGDRHLLHFRCPETDARIGGGPNSDGLDGVNAPEWRHTPYARRQRQWLDRELGRSTADWKIVVGHYPVWSIAEHGPTQELVDDLRPLLEKYNVAMYLNGHDHNAQHLNDGSNVEYLVVGAGSPVDADTTHKGDVGGPEWPDTSGTCKFYWARKTAERNACKEDPDCEFDATVRDGSFARVEFKNRDEAEIEIVSHNGEVLYTLRKPNPKFTGERYSSIDRVYTEGAEQKRYVPYKEAAAVPVVASTSDTDGVGTVVLILMLLTMAVVGFMAKAPFCSPMRRALCSRQAKQSGDAPSWFKAGMTSTNTQGYREDGIYGTTAASTITISESDEAI